MKQGRIQKWHGVIYAIILILMLTFCVIQVDNKNTQIEKIKKENIQLEEYIKEYELIIEVSEDLKERFEIIIVDIVKYNLKEFEKISYQEYNNLLRLIESYGKATHDYYTDYSGELTFERWLMVYRNDLYNELVELDYK